MKRPNYAHEQFPTLHIQRMRAFLRAITPEPAVDVAEEPERMIDPLDYIPVPDLEREEVDT